MWKSLIHYLFHRNCDWKFDRDYLYSEESKLKRLLKIVFSCGHFIYVKKTV